jgi:hypothetical protein
MIDKTRAMMKFPKPSDTLFQDLRALIIDARQDVARQVNSALVLLYWRVGKRIRQDILKEKRAEYGEEILSTLSRKLVAEFGNGFSTRNLWHMIRFTEAFPDEKIVNSLSTQLGWTHFRHIIALDDPLKRDFYAEMCRIERWSTRTLEKKISGMLFERTALSRKPVELAKQELAQLREEDKLTPDLVFRDPYFLDFLTCVMQWKQRRKPALDQGEVGLTIRNLAALNWLNVKASDDLPLPAEETVDA